MVKQLDVDDRERDVLYIDAREFNKNKDGYDRGTGILQYFFDFKNSNKKFADRFKHYTEDNIVTNRNLPVGDVLHNDVCCEIKEYDTQDLLNSVWSERLPRQSHELYQLRDPNLLENPLKDCRILIVADYKGYNHIHNSPSVYKGLLNFSGETPVNFANYSKTKKFKYNKYGHLADTIVHLLGMNGNQIGRQSHASMTKNMNSAVNYLLSPNILSKNDSTKICKHEGLYSWRDANEFMNKTDITHTYNTLLKCTTRQKAQAMIKVVYGHGAFSNLSALSK